MPFVSSCCCSRHDEWKHGAVDSNHLRQCTREEAEILDFASNDPKNNPMITLSEDSAEDQ